MSENFSIVAVVFIIAGGFVTIVRALLDYRKSVTLIRAQAEAHVKLMEKLASSQELLSYMETEAGKHFLQLVAVGAERPRGPQFPFGRILWSVQAGLTVLFAGLGLLFVRTRVTEPGSSDGFLVLGTLAVVIGLGFLVSAAASYVISKHLGLLEREPLAHRA